jgi:hypothetical protein
MQVPGRGCIVDQAEGSVEVHVEEVAKDGDGACRTSRSARPFEEEEYFYDGVMLPGSAEVACDSAVKGGTFWL